MKPHYLCALCLFFFPKACLAQEALEETRNKSDDTLEAVYNANRPAPVRTEKWPGRTKIWPAHWYTDKAWWLGEGVIASIEAGDGYSTAVGLERCPTCRESNFLLGPHPSRSEIIGGSILGFGLRSALHVASWKFCPDPNHRSRVWRMSCDSLIPAITTALTVPAIIGNLGLRSSGSTLTTAAVKRSQAAGVMSNAVAPSTNGEIVPPFLRNCSDAFGTCGSFPPVTSPKVDLHDVHLR